MKKILVVLSAVVVGFIFALGDSFFTHFSFNDWKNPFARSTIEPSTPATPAPIDTPAKPVIDLEPTLSFQEHLEKGDYYFDRGFFTFATHEYTKAAKRDPQNTQPYLKLMEAQFELGNYDQVLANATTVLGLDPGNIEAPYYQVITAIKQSRFEEAEQLIGATLTAQQNPDPRLFYYQAVLDTLFDRHDSAQKRFTEAATLLTTDYPDYLEFINEFTNAYREFGFAQSAEPDYLDTLLARAYNKNHLYEFTVFKLRDLLQSRSDLRDAWILRGFAYLNLQQFIFALNAFEQAYRLDSQWAPTQYFLGLTYAEIGKKEDAIVYLNYALKNGFTPDIVVKQKLADLYLDAGHYQESVALYEELLTSHAPNVNEFVRPIWIYVELLNQPESALPLARSAIEAFPSDAMAHNLLGWALLGVRDYDSAAISLNHSIQLDPDLAAPYFNLGQLFERTDQVDQALEFYQKAFELDRNGSIGNQAAKAYNRLLTE
ncbi:tetratricopeptide repeat protein [Candidatus Peregrinibacteria bacterium]|nr:MAG: tetratricopeptide repeat protein [Candidatus Peregrinibacteria bacterium]